MDNLDEDDDNVLTELVWILLCLAHVNKKERSLYWHISFLMP